MTKRRFTLIHLILALYFLGTFLAGKALTGVMFTIAPSMIWNVFLAMIAFDAAYLLSLAKNKLLLLLTAIIAFLFYPNTFYLITDVKHVADWFPSGRLIFEDSHELIGFTILIVGILLGVILGMLAFEQVGRRFFRKAWQLIAFLLIMNFLSSVAIYAGRISSLRLNSWDIFINPLTTLSKLISVINPQQAVFLTTFTIIQVTFCSLALLIFQKEEENEN